MKFSADLPTFDKIFEIISPPNPILRFILQLGDWLPDDIRQQVNKSRPRLHFRAIRRKRKPMLCNLQQGNSQAPHVARNRVTLTRYPLWRHVVTRANECVSVTLCTKLAGHAEVTQLNLAVTAEKDVGWFDVTMDDAVLVQVGQAVEYAFCDFAQHLFSCTAAELLHFTVDCIE